MKIGITGYKGRVGTLLTQEILSGRWQGVTLAGGLDMTPGSGEENFFTTQNAEDFFPRCDVVIDFTRPDAVENYAALAVKNKVAYVVGTTGLNESQEKSLKNAAEHIPVLYTANMSVGVNILLALVEQAAARLKEDWDIEIFESHHHHKIDAPSGTALALGKAVAKGRDVHLPDVADYARYGETGARKEGSIGFSVARGGDVVGDHTVYFYGQGERLELTHRATNRALFARGALRGAMWLKDKPAGLYSMRDVLGL